MITTRFIHYLRLGTLAATAAATLVACGGGSSDATLELNLSGLEDLGSTAAYEGWLIVQGAPVTAGRFTVDANGRLSQTRFAIPHEQADAATAFVLTIEPAQNDLPGPTDTHLIAGDFNADKTAASLNISHPAALGSDFSAVRGSFILATPSSATTDDENQGIWWLNMVGGAPKPSLTLPTLPKGWIYEGWVVVGGKPVSTGRFDNPAAADLDGGGPAKGPLGTPPFPGQDFIVPPTVPTGGTAVISIEPEQDNSPAPFTLKPLVGTIGAATGPTNIHPMSNNFGDGAKLPRGALTLTR